MSADIDIEGVKVVVEDPGTPVLVNGRPVASMEELLALGASPAIDAARAVLAAKLDPKTADPSTADLLTALAVIVGDAG